MHIDFQKQPICNTLNVLDLNVRSDNYHTDSAVSQYNNVFNNEVSGNTKDVILKLIPPQVGL